MIVFMTELDKCQSSNLVLLGGCSTTTMIVLRLMINRMFPAWAVVDLQWPEPGANEVSENKSKWRHCARRRRSCGNVFYVFLLKKLRLRLSRLEWVNIKRCSFEFWIMARCSCRVAFFGSGTVGVVSNPVLFSLALLLFCTVCRWMWKVIRFVSTVFEFLALCGEKCGCQMYVVARRGKRRLNWEVVRQEVIGMTGSSVCLSYL